LTHRFSLRPVALQVVRSAWEAEELTDVGASRLGFCTSEIIGHSKANIMPLKDEIEDHLKTLEAIYFLVHHLGDNRDRLERIRRNWPRLLRKDKLHLRDELRSEVKWVRKEVGALASNKDYQELFDEIRVQLDVYTQPMPEAQKKLAGKVARVLLPVAPKTEKRSQGERVLVQ
jgi:uncharacterized protein YdcH (DUF465 family)